MVRWLMGSGSTEHNMPAATFAVESIYGLSGALNVLLFLFMHPLRSSLRNTEDSFVVAPTQTTNKFAEIHHLESTIVGRRD
jgi:hypothetical protein